MFREELELIKKTEDDAEAMGRAARTEARRLTEDARGQAARMLTEAESEAKARFEARVQEGQDAASVLYEEAMAAAAAQCEALAETAAQAEKSCIEMIVERIVKSSVNN